jgi:alpha-beta hydrolase superfamily lysophospholipase
MSWLEELRRPERLVHGHVIVLPGIEGHSRFNRSILRGLQAAGLPHAMEIHDWTFGRWQSLRSLRSTRRHEEQSARIAEKIAATQAAHPGAPIWLIGHSGGGAMSVLTLERLAAEQPIEGAILLAPALSPGYSLATPLARTRRGIWNFSSWGDAFFLMFGTLLMGTVDGRHAIAAGARGFRGSSLVAETPDHPGPRLYEVPWRREMAGDRHFAGHFGPVHARFVERWVAPILTPASANENART